MQFFAARDWVNVFESLMEAYMDVGGTTIGI